MDAGMFGSGSGVPLSASRFASGGAEPLVGTGGDIELTVRGAAEANGNRSEQEAVTHTSSWKNRRGSTRQRMFMDPEEVKAQMRRRMYKKQYDPADGYHTTGLAQQIARSHWFETITFAMIMLNTVYIGYDTEYNNADLLLRADLKFQIMANVFCLFFTWEIVVRFLAFKEKRSCLHDAWFVFDSSLVGMMMFETWVMSLVVMMFGDEGSTHILGSMPHFAVGLRLVKFVRVARLMRLARIFPDLMVLLRGIGHALGSVFFTLVLLFMLAYVFAIAFTLFVRDDFESHKNFFGSVSRSLVTLLVRGTLLDEISDLVEALITDSHGKGAWYLLPMLLVYVLLSALTVLNLLIGVMCEAVSSVADVHREEDKLESVKELVQNTVLPKIPKGSTKLSRDTFRSVLEADDGATQALQGLGVDAIGLVDIADFLFQQDPGTVSGTSANNAGATFTAGEREMELTEFVELVMRLRSSNKATVKDLVETQKFMKHSIAHLGESLRKSIQHELRRTQRSWKPSPPAVPAALDVTFGLAESQALTARVEDVERALAEAQRTYQDFAKDAVAAEPSGDAVIDEPSGNAVSEWPQTGTGAPMSSELESAASQQSKRASVEGHHSAGVEGWRRWH